VAAGVGQVFGVVGSGNFHVTNAMVAAGARFVAARHEGGAATMADAYARTSGTVTALSVHQGCGLTNAMTGIAEAAKSRTPILVLAAEAGEPRSNFAVDQDALARAVGATAARITSARTAVAEATSAFDQALQGRRTVLLNLPLAVQALVAPALDLPSARPATAMSGQLATPTPLRPPAAHHPSPLDVSRLVSALRVSRRPVFVAGRGARGREARDALRLLASRTGALLATSAAAKGLFHDDPWSLDVSGGFASPVAAELVARADLVVGWGCTLNMWTMRHGRLIARDAVVVQVDDTPTAIGAHRDLTFGIIGDAAATARAVLATMPDEASDLRYRTGQVRARLRTSVRWRDVPYDDRSVSRRIDPRTLTIALDDLLPTERVVAVDSGNFMGYPSMFLSVPDELGFCFTQAFQSVGLGLATAIGAGLAQPHRLAVAALGDGGALMGAAELETVRRLGMPMVVLVYNDNAYGAEVHHFGPGGHDLGTVVFPETDIAAIARGYGFTGVTVRDTGDLAAVAAWLDGPRDSPLLIDAKITSDEPSWWLHEAFQGH